MPEFQKSERAALVFLALATFSLFLNNLPGTWILDDHYHVERNPHIRSLESIPRLLTTSVWQSTSEETPDSDIYRPVLMISWLFNRLLLGPDPWGFHLISNLIHLCNVLLLFCLLRRFFGFSVSFFWALLFSVHPMVVEAVTWIGGRQELLLGLFALLYVHTLLRLEEKERSRGLQWALVGLIPLGLFSKETFVLLPFAAWIALCRSKWKMLIPAIAVTVLCLVWRNRIVGRSLTSLLSTAVPANADALLERFLVLLLNPSDSDFAYRYSSVTGVRAFLPFGFFVLIGVGLLFLGRKNRSFLLGFGMFLAPLVPVFFILDLVGMIYERYFYLPLAGMAVMGASLRVNLKVQRVLWGIAALYLLMLGGTTFLRNREWRDEPTLYASSMRRDPTNEAPYFLLAGHFRRSGDRASEIENYRQVLLRNPRHRPALNNLAVRLTELGQFGEAKQFLDRAYQLQPNLPKTSFNYGYYYEAVGDRKTAREWYSRAVALKPNYTLANEALNRLASLP